MDQELKDALKAHLLALGDDELILGHRDSEWCGHAPILEEDIAFANLALDEIGHAKLWYGLLAELMGEDPEAYPDRLVFFREPEAFRSAQMVELPKGDWAFSILRQWLFDAAEKVRLDHLKDSLYAPLAGAAAKIRTEEIYHLRHSQAWVRRLGLGTHESHARLQKALDELWPHTQQLFTSQAGEALLETAGIIPSSAQLETEWNAQVKPILEEAGLTLSQATAHTASRAIHTRHLSVLVTEMQSVARLDPEAEW